MGMKRYLPPSLVFLAVFLPSLASNIPEDWQGLWEVTQVTETGHVTIYLWLPVKNEGRVVLYGTNWEPQALSSWSVRGSELTFNWQNQSVNIFFKGTRNPNSRAVAGNWQLIHPQYVLKRNFTARKILSLEDWTPLSFSPSTDERTPIIDGVAQGIEQLEKGAFDDFEARFFALVSGHGSLSNLKQTLQNGVFQKQNAELKGILEEILKRLDETYSGYTLPAQIVLLPVGDLATRYELLKRKFVLFNAAKLDPNLGVDRRKTEIARSLFELGVDYELPLMDSAVLQLWTRAVPLGLIKSIGLSDDPASILQLTSQECGRLQQRLPALKAKLKAKQKLSEAEEDVVALAFAEHAGSQMAPTRLGLLGPDRMKKLYEEFLKAP